MVSASDYQEIFGQDYSNASGIIEENTWWSDSLENDGIEPGFAFIVVFPELIRYSSIAELYRNQSAGSFICPVRPGLFRLFNRTFPDETFFRGTESNRISCNTG